MSNQDMRNKAWRPLSAEIIATLPAQLGVFQVASPEGEVLAIGYAGATHPFGMRTALSQEAERLSGLGELSEPAKPDSGAAQFRLEYTSNYRSRWNELLMLHVAEFGELPPAQAERPSRIGRLQPAS